MYGPMIHDPALRRPTRATKPAFIGATDRPEPHWQKNDTKIN